MVTSLEFAAFSRRLAGTLALTEQARLCRFFGTTVRLLFDAADVARPRITSRVFQMPVAGRVVKLPSAILAGVLLTRTVL